MPFPFPLCLSSSLGSRLCSPARRRLKVSTKSLADKWISAIHGAVDAERLAFAEQEERHQRWKNNYRSIRTDSFKLAPVAEWTEADGESCAE